jgi:GTP cyclohydrolase IA
MAANVLGSTVTKDTVALYSDGDSRIEAFCREFLSYLGENPDRAGLQKTPERFRKSMLELTSGYDQSLKEIAAGAVFEESSSQMVVLKRIEFYSMCEHHILPFFGYANIAYIPRGHIIGLSKIPQIVNMFARRLQVQERLTSQIVEALDELLDPEGVACSIEANHLCMMMRGVQIHSASMVTNVVKGRFKDEAALRDEFQRAIART